MHRFRINPCFVCLVMFAMGCPGGRSMKTKSTSVVHYDMTANDPHSFRTVEYYLPCAEMAEQVKESLHPWLRQMVGCDHEAVQLILDERWAKMTIEPLRLVKEAVRDFRPTSIVVLEDRTGNKESWLLLARPAPNRGWGPERAELLIAPPLSQEALDKGFQKCKFADSPLLRSLILDFGAQYETIPRSSGGFCISEWMTLYDYWGDNDGRYPAWYEQWQGALGLYGSPSGDLVLLHPSGKVAWMWFAEGDVTPLADDLAGFLRYYADYRTKKHHALDPAH